MKLSDAYPRQAKPAPVTVEPPPKRNLCGPEVIVGTVRATSENHIRLWNDPMDRLIHHGPYNMGVFDHASKHDHPLTVTVQKIKGRWCVVSVETA
jgi:hypothetical protein